VQTCLLAYGSWLVGVARTMPVASLLAFMLYQVGHYMTQPLVELYGGCIVALKVSWWCVTCSTRASCWSTRTTC
jgi:hypothetical protein